MRTIILTSLVAASALSLSLPAFSNSHTYSKHTRYTKHTQYNDNRAYPINTNCCNKSGLYIGGQAGYAHADYDLGEFVNTHFRDDDFAGRIYLGYQFNENVGLESGFAMFTNSDLPADFGDIKTAHWDLLLKVGTPFGNSGFRGDIKGGIAHVMTDFDAGNLANSLDITDDSNRKIRAVAGAGISYNLNHNVAVDVSYLHVFGDPQNNAFSTPNNDMVTLGLSFLFNC